MDRQKPLLKCEELEAFCSSRRLNSARAQRVSKLRLAEPKMPFLWLILLLCLCSCRSADISHYVSMSDTTYIHTINHDSIHTTDSVFVYQNDTTRVVYKSRNNYIYKISKDTLYKVVRDTIYTTNIQNKDCISPHERDGHPLFCIIVVSILILLFIYKKFK